MFAIEEKFVIIIYMKNAIEQENTIFNRLGERTREKAAGLSFSLAAVLPTFLSLIFLVVISALGLTKEGYQNSDWFLYASYLLPQISFIIVAAAFFRFLKLSPKAVLKKQKCSIKYYILAIVLQIGLLCLSELNVWFLKLLGNFGYQDAGILLPSMDGVGFFGVFFVVAILAPVLEETLFRGMILSGLKPFGITGAALFCGALFALYHQNPSQTIYQFCCGAAFALVALKSGSTLPTVLSHFLNNAAILILTKFRISQFSTPVFIVVVAVSAICLIGSLTYLLFVDGKSNGEKAEPKTTDKSKKKNFLLFAAVGIFICAVSWIGVFVSGL